MTDCEAVTFFVANELLEEPTALQVFLLPSQGRRPYGSAEAQRRPRAVLLLGSRVCCAFVRSTFFCFAIVVLSWLRTDLFADL